MTQNPNTLACPKMIFVLNPYDSVLDLADRDDRKLFTEGCKGLKENDVFDGKKQNYGNFVKLIEGELLDTRTMEALEIHTNWRDGGDTDAAKRIPLADKKINTFGSNKATKENVTAYCDLVWEDTDFGADTPRYFKEFATAPTDKASLDTLRNHQRQKHVMLGKKIWNSLSSNFKIEITGSKSEFQRMNEIDGVLLWDFIRRRTNPTTTVGASKLKDDIENVKLEKFDQDVIKYNTWFVDTRIAIIKEEGTGYNEYLRSLFRAYLTCVNEEFLEAIKEERRKWIQGKLSEKYSFRDLLDLGRVTYNNLLDEDSWNKVSKKKGKEEDKNFLALATEMMKKMSNMKGSANGAKNGGERTYRPWRFDNPDNKETMEVRGSTMKWCKNDCHPRPMWCGRKNCMNRSEYAAEWKKKNEAKKKDGPKEDFSSSEFKIALAAMTSPEDFAVLQEQFGSLKE